MAASVISAARSQGAPSALVVITTAANRQTCVDVLCAYLRMPYEPKPGDDAPVAERLAFQASREVRHTVIRDGAAQVFHPEWQEVTIRR